MGERGSGRAPMGTGSCRSGDAAAASSSLRDGDPSRSGFTQDDRIAEMFFDLANEADDCIDPKTCPRASVDFKRIADRAAAYGYLFYGGERPASAMEAEGRDAQQLGAKPDSAIGNAETPNPLPQNHHDRSGTGSEVKED
ncbi:hypothetical protein [Methylorubrum sp. SB2]|uniref:hypothetical protein n=1 Tax=Methylorubrum subtropicum TaxID=3138812 RepID=UPI00313B0004